MAEQITHNGYIVYDACCLINIAATGSFEDIVKVFPNQGAIAAYVMDYEALSFMGPSGQEMPIQLDALIGNGSLIRVELDLSNEDEATYVVELESQNLDAGEAESGAIAINRGYALATDEKRAINVIRQLSPSTQIITTPDLIKHWADTARISQDATKNAIRRISKYIPPKSHPLLAWWLAMLDNS